MMRFRGGGVGHFSTRAETDTFKNDRDRLDILSYQNCIHTHMDEGDHGEDNDKLEMDISDGALGAGEIEGDSSVKNESAK